MGKPCQPPKKAKRMQARNITLLVCVKTLKPRLALKKPSCYKPPRTTQILTLNFGLGCNPSTVIKLCHFKGCCVYSYLTKPKPRRKRLPLKSYEVYFEQIINGEIKTSGTCFVKSISRSQAKSKFLERFKQRGYDTKTIRITKLVEA